MLRRLSTPRSWLWLTAILTGALLLIAPATPAAAAGSVTPMVWHRYNVYEPISPSHERLRCLTDGQWRCLYDTVPAPTLGFSNPLVKGTFVGTDVTDSWECPAADWFPTDICDSAAQVVSGTQSFVFPGFGQAVCRGCCLHRHGRRDALELTGSTSLSAPGIPPSMRR